MTLPCSRGFICRQSICSAGKNNPPRGLIFLSEDISIDTDADNIHDVKKSAKIFMRKEEREEHKR